MEFEAEEEMQIQNTQLMNGSQGLPPAASLKLDPPGLLAPEASQQPGKATQFQIGALGQRLKGRRTQSQSWTREGTALASGTFPPGSAIDVPNRTYIGGWVFRFPWSQTLILAKETN